MPNAGTDTLSVIFTPTDTSDYKIASADTTIAVAQATPTITWAVPASIVYGTALTAAQLDATSTVAGSFAYSPAAGAVPNVGTDTLSVIFTPTDTTDYKTATAGTTIVVAQATPTITWASPASIVYGTALSAIQLDATANVPGTFAYSLAAGTVLGAGSQTLSVTFTPTDTTDYKTATAETTIVAGTGDVPTITWPAPANAIVYEDGTDESTLDADDERPRDLHLLAGRGHRALGAGSQTLSVTFTPTDTTDFKTTTADTTIVVAQATTATPTITWASPASIVYGTALSAAQLDATSNVAGTFAYSPAAGTVLGAGAQTLSVTFTPTDTTDYTTATADTTIVVAQATPTITWASPVGIVYGTALSAAQLDATSNVAGTFAYSPAAGTLPNAGTQTLSVTFTPTDTTDYKSVSADTTIAVARRPQPSPGRDPRGIVYGTAATAARWARRRP